MTDIPLLTHIDQRIRDLELRLSEQRDDLRDRLSGMNEFRDALRDQASQMATRNELQDLKTHLDSKIEAQRELLTQSRIQVASLAAVVSLVTSVTVALMTYLLRP